MLSVIKLIILMLSVIKLIILMLSVIMLSFVVLSVIMFSILTLSVIMLSILTLSVVMSNECCYAECCSLYCGVIIQSVIRVSVAAPQVVLVKSLQGGHDRFWSLKALKCFRLTKILAPQHFANLPSHQPIKSRLNLL